MNIANEIKLISPVLIVGLVLVILWIGYKTLFFKIGWMIRYRKFPPRKGKLIWVVEDEIAMPFSGKLIPLSEVPNTMYAEKLIGDGFAIETTGENITSPVEGTITQIYSNFNALTFKTLHNKNVIVHIGDKCRNLKDEGVTINILEGVGVKLGDMVGKVDLSKLPHHDVISPIVFPNLTDTERIIVKRFGEVKAGERGVAFIERLKQCKK